MNRFQVIVDKVTSTVSRTQSCRGASARRLAARTLLEETSSADAAAPSFTFSELKASGWRTTIMKRRRMGRRKATWKAFERKCKIDPRAFFSFFSVVVVVVFPIAATPHVPATAMGLYATTRVRDRKTGCCKVGIRERHRVIL